VAVPGAVEDEIVLQASLVPAIGSNCELVAGSPFAVTGCGAAEPKARVPVCSCW